MGQEDIVRQWLVFSLAPLLCAVLFAASSAHAATVLFDNFDSYTTGNLSGQGGWTATAAAATPMQVAGAADKFVQINTSGQDEYKAFTSPIPHLDGNTMTTSFNINVSAAQAAGDYFSHLSDPVGTTSFFFQRLFARSSGAGYQLGILATSGGANPPTYGATVLNFGQEYHIDIDWNFVVGPINDTFAVRVGAAPYVSYIWDTPTAEPAQLSAGNLRQGTAANSATLQFDDISVSGFVPEPASLGILAMTALLGLRRRK
jgi:hypothetical protein